MSQNGSHAWELSYYNGAAPWDYRQILTHYYSNVNVPDTHNSYRWVWLDVTPDIKFDTTEDYYGPLARTPATMQTGQIYSVQMRIKNTGLIPWTNGGSQPVRLSYHWYDSSGNNPIIWDGLRTVLGQNVSPTDEVTLNAQVMAPTQPGTYILKWDMVKEGVTWFSQQQDWPTQNVMVNVETSEGRTFLPDIRAAKDGWDSVMYIRNDGAETANVTISLYNINGTLVITNGYPANYNVASNALLFHMPMLAGLSDWQGSAVVDASEDVSVVVFNVGPNQVHAYNGVVPTGGSGDPTFEQNGTTLYAPSFYRDKWGYDSTAAIMNVGSSDANVQVQFKGRSGYSSSTVNYIVAANGSRTVTAPSGNWVGSLVITSQNGQPLAVTVYETYQYDDFTRGYNTSSEGRSVFHIPAAYKNKWGMTTGLVVQNVHSSQSATARLRFYDRNGNYTTFVDLSNIGSGRAQGLWLGNVGGLGSSWTGSVKVESINGQPLAMTVQTSKYLSKSFVAFESRVK